MRVCARARMLTLHQFSELLECELQKTVDGRLNLVVGLALCDCMCARVHSRCANST